MAGIRFFTTLWLLALLFPNRSPAQGKLLLIGGGSERNGEYSWSTPAYRWAVDQSANRKVAIIYYNSFNDELKNYFLSQCQAKAVAKFELSNRALADRQDTYDSLMRYDVFFFRGGDQLQYYNLFKGTLTEQAVMDKFSQGGVVCGTSAGMAILGESDFIAANGTAYPDEVLMNPFDPVITLRHDCMNLLDGFLLDTHFTQRGRFGRLIGFLANQYLGQNEKYTGIGVDDLTALAVDSQLMARVFGTGAAHIYRLTETEPFAYSEGRLSAPPIAVSQVLHGGTINLSTFAVHSEGLPVVPGNSEECRFEVLAGGSDQIAENESFYLHLVQSAGSPADSILILHGPAVDPTPLTNALNDAGADHLVTAVAEYANSYDLLATQRIRQCPKILFFRNQATDLEEFLSFGTTGNAFKERLSGGDCILAFAGEDARYAGSWYAANTNVADASYNGSILFSKGLGVFTNTVIMPGAFENSDTYENTASAVPYAQVKYALRYGIWLNGDGFIHYENPDGSPYMRAFGQFPTLVMTHRGSPAGMSSHTPAGDTLTHARMIAGFHEGTLTIPSPGEPFLMSDLATPTSGMPSDAPKVFPNPVGNWFIIEHTCMFSFQLFDTTGQVVQYGPPGRQTVRVETGGLLPGVYWLRVLPDDGHSPALFKMVKL